MYKMKNNLSSSRITELFRRPNNRYELRNADVVIPRYNIVKYGKHSVRYYGPYIWSKLDVEDQEKPSLESSRETLEIRILKIWQTIIVENGFSVLPSILKFI